MALVEVLWHHVSAKGLFVFFAVSFVLWRILVSVDQRMQLPGGRAKLVKTTLPFGKSARSPSAHGHTTWPRVVSCPGPPVLTPW